MTSKDTENIKLIADLDKREAGVKDLFEFYIGVETVYAASIKALEEGNISVVANSANNK